MAKFYKNIKTTITLMGILCFCVICTTPPSQAKDNDDIFTRFRKPMPEIPRIDEEKFIKRTKPVKKRPYDQDVLAYTMRIPKDWTEREDRSASSFLLSDKLLLELNVFYGKPSISGQSRIEVQALNLKGNLTAEQWYINHILKSGYTTEGLVTHNQNKIESFMVTMENEQPYYLRTLVTLNGSKIIMVRYFVPASYIGKQGAMQAQVIESFNLIHDVERTYEEETTYRFLDIASVKHPKNWKVYAKPLRSVDYIEALFLNHGEQRQKNSKSVEGKLNITVVSAIARDSLIDEIKKYKQKLEESGILIGKKLNTTEDFSYDEDIDFALTELYEGINSGSGETENEFWFTVMVGGNYYYFLTLFTPSRNNRFKTWAENTQSYKRILEQFQPMTGAFLERD